LNMPFMPDNQASKIAKPCECAFHNPSLPITSELSSILSLGLFSVSTMRDNQINFKCFQLFSQWIAVICSICNQTYRSFFRSTFKRTGYVDRIKSFLRKLHFRGRSRGKEASQRNTLAVDHHHPLCAFAPFGFTNASAPFFADTKLPSINASCQSMRPFSSSIDKNFRQTSSQTPRSSQSLNRLQQVEGLGYLCGKSCHLAPVRSIHRIPSRTCRLSAGGRPPLGLAFGFGSIGPSFFHCSSFMNCVYLAIESPPIAYYTKSFRMSSFINICKYYILNHFKRLSLT
jgi:hypothetical protein